MSKPPASLSLDLDNKWSYLKVHGDASWSRFPSYLDLVVPHMLGLFEDLGLTATIFVVGQDAALAKNGDALAALAEAGHEIANHSFHHEPWLHLYEYGQLHGELAAAEDAIERATGVQPVGFRGPGFSRSDALFAALVKRGYWYDASTLPTFLGPVARAYYFLTSNLSRQERQQRKALFGKFRDGLLPLRPYRREAADGRGLWEVPVTTMPVLRLPIHMSYLHYLSRFSKLSARTYWHTALSLCRLTGTAPSLLLHPLDFLGRDDESDLNFFPGMDLPGQQKRAFVSEVVASAARHYELLPLKVQVERLAGEKLSPRTGAAAVPVVSELVPFDAVSVS